MTQLTDDIGGLFIFAVTILVVLKMIFREREPNLDRSRQECEYKTFNKRNQIIKKEFQFMLDTEPQIQDISNEPEVSIIIPAYNEEQRLPVCLDEIFQVFSKTDILFEIIVVNDGSKDATSDVVLEYVKKYDENIKLLELSENKGKGGAVRMGVLSSRGEHILMCDADGATKFEEFFKLYTEIKQMDNINGNIVIGSRAHLEKDSIAKRSKFRTILMHGFHLFVKIIGGIADIKDTQCGFKLFDRKSAKLLFSNLHLERWAFDVELLYMASLARITVKEMSVVWTEIDGSKLSPVGAAISMAKDLLMLRFCYTLGIYKMKHR